MEKMWQKSARNLEKSWKILEKSWKILEKSWKILKSYGFFDFSRFVRFWDVLKWMTADFERKIGWNVALKYGLKKNEIG